MRRNSPSINLTVALISFNEEERIGLTLESVKDIADEIILIDSMSTDKTAEIAKSYGAKVYLEEWKGFEEQKNSLLEKCTGEWILYLDCDEEATAELGGEIMSIIDEPATAADGYYINRRTKYLGKILKRSWQPDYKLRFVKKSAPPRWVGEYVHEALKIKGQKAYFKGELIHHSYKNIADHMRKTIKYAGLSSEAAHNKGKRGSISKIFFVAPFAFFKSYFLKGGFIDGIQGLIASFSAYVYFFLKYAMIWEKDLKKTKHNEK